MVVKEERYDQRAKCLLEEWEALKRGVAVCQVRDEVAKSLNSLKDSFAKVLEGRADSKNPTKLELRLLAAQKSLESMAVDWRLLEEVLGLVSSLMKEAL